MPQVIGTPLHVVAPRDELRLLVARPRRALEGDPHPLPLLPGVAEGVQHVPLRGWLEQGLRFVLSVEVYQHAAQRGEGRHRGGAAVGPRPVASLGIDLPAHDEAVVLGLDAELVGRRAEPWQAADLEGGFHDGAGRPRTHQIRARPLTQQQRERVDQHRLPGAGLAGEHVQAWLEGKRDVRDDREVSNPKLSQHG